MMRREEGVADIVERLVESGRIQRSGRSKLVARDFVIPLGSSEGWEAAVFDHVQAVVQTVCQRLSQSGLDGGGAAPVRPPCGRCSRVLSACWRSLAPARSWH